MASSLQHELGVLGEVPAEHSSGLPWDPGGLTALLRHEQWSLMSCLGVFILKWSTDEQIRNHSWQSPMSDTLQEFCLGVLEGPKIRVPRFSGDSEWLMSVSFGCTRGWLPSLSHDKGELPSLSWRLQGQEDRRRWDNFFSKEFRKQRGRSRDGNSEQLLTAKE